MKKWVFLIIVPLCLGCRQQVPNGFVELQQVAPGIKVSLRYNSTDNFMGARVKGYYSNKCYLTREAAEELIQVQEELESQGLGLKIFDAYRPQRAVDHFVTWAEDLSDTTNKSIYYPKVPKSELFERGYIASRSGHTRGSTLDLTLVDASGEELDMGTPWDFFSETSWPDSEAVSRDQYENRQLLRRVMTNHGFKPYDKEWWHFTLDPEPYPDQYFNFPVR